MRECRLRGAEWRSVRGGGIPYGWFGVWGVFREVTVGPVVLAFKLTVTVTVRPAKIFLDFFARRRREIFLGATFFAKKVWLCAHATYKHTQQ